MYKTHFLRLHPPPFPLKNNTHQHFSNRQFTMKMIKQIGQHVESVQNQRFFYWPPPPPPPFKGYVNVDAEDLD